tara:strand:- start:95 stop:1210 length:1116 start_codon:yes stop_codon:yes gene_type:complete
MITFLYDQFNNICSNYLLNFIKNENIDYLTYDIKEAPADLINPVYVREIENFDPAYDYFQLLDARVKQKLLDGEIKYVFYSTSETDEPMEVKRRLSRLCNNHGIPKSHIEYLTPNYASEKYDEFTVFPHFELKVYYEVRNNVPEQFENNRRQRIFTCNNMHNSIHTKIFCMTIWQHGFHKSGFFSYPMSNITDEFDHPENIPIMQWHEYWENLPNLLSVFDLHTPINEQLIVNRDDRVFYQQSYWNFIVQKNYFNDAIILSEEMFRCVANLQPFTVLGKQNTLREFRKHGYQTLDGIINESYDMLENDEQRLNKCFLLGYHLMSQPDEWHINLISKAKNALFHNQREFLKPKKGMLQHVIDTVVSSNQIQK